MHRASPLLPGGSPRRGSLSLSLAALLLVSGSGCASVERHALPLPPGAGELPDWTPSGETLEGEGFTREDRAFPCGDAICAAWLYLPEGASAPPVVVMAHGFAGDRDMGLAPYAEGFARLGMASLVFDYRSWGDSGGAPRYVIDPEAQAEDYASAMAYARRIPEVDGARVALWGTSYSGGHVLTAAAADGDIKALVAQVPDIDGQRLPAFAGLTDRLPALVRLARRDRARARREAPRLYVKAYGEASEVATLVGPELLVAMDEMVPEGSDWPNRVAASIALDMLGYRPIKDARDVACPALFVVGERDIYVSNKATARAARRMDDAEVMRLDVTHFGIYRGAAFETALAAEGAFLARHLGVGAP